MLRIQCISQYFFCKSENQIFGFLAGEHKGRGELTYDETSETLMHLYIYIIQTLDQIKNLYIRPESQIFMCCVKISKNFFQILYLESGFLSITYLMTFNLARLKISILLSLCSITGGHTIERLLLQTSVEPTLFLNSISKVGLKGNGATLH